MLEQISSNMSELVAPKTAEEILHNKTAVTRRLSLPILSEAIPTMIWAIPPPIAPAVINGPTKTMLPVRSVIFKADSNINTPKTKDVLILVKMEFRTPVSSNNVRISTRC